MIDEKLEAVGLEDLHVERHIILHPEIVVPFLVFHFFEDHLYLPGNGVVEMDDGFVFAVQGDLGLYDLFEELIIVCRCLLSIVRRRPGYRPSFLAMELQQADTGTLGISSFRVDEQVADKAQAWRGSVCPDAGAAMPSLNMTAVGISGSIRSAFLEQKPRPRDPV